MSVTRRVALSFLLASPAIVRASSLMRISPVPAPQIIGILPAIVPAFGYKNIRIVWEQGKTGLFFATSPEMRGLLVAEQSLEAMCNAIPEAVRALAAARGAPPPEITLCDLPT